MESFVQKSKYLLNQLCYGVILIDPQKNIVFANQATLKLSGFKAEELVGRKCEFLCSSQNCSADCPVDKVMESGQCSRDFKSFMQIKNSESTPVLLDISILKDKDGNHTGCMLSFRPDNRIDYQIPQGIESRIGLIGQSKVMKDLFNLIEEISNSDASVLITGASGTGKELVANAIQATSKRDNKPFIKVNCSVFPEDLLGSELFGHRRGAFTDAKQDRIGRFELADGGTIFLDEVAEMPLSMQIKLLRILQDGTFERLGESKTRKVNVRVIAATNADIATAVQAGKFREDLYYRISVIPIEVPPLKQRISDIPYLVNHFIQKYAALYERNITFIDQDALSLLLDYDWPGNVRELENCIEYGIIRSKKDTAICSCGLPAKIRSHLSCPDESGLSVNLDELKRDQIIGLLDRFNWNKSKVAEFLGVHRSTLWRRLKKI